MMGLGATELLIILAIVVILFGASRIGDLGSSMGRGIREFRKAVRDDDDPQAQIAKIEQEQARKGGRDER